MAPHAVHTDPGGPRSYRLEVRLEEVGADVTAAIAAWSLERVSPASRVVLRRRREGFVLSIDAAWGDPAGDAVNVAWARACHADFARLAAARAAGDAVL